MPRDRRTRAQLLKALDIEISNNRNISAERDAVTAALNAERRGGGSADAKTPMASLPEFHRRPDMPTALAEVVAIGFSNVGIVHLTAGTVLPDQSVTVQAAIGFPMTTAKALHDALSQVLRAYETARGIIPMSAAFYAAPLPNLDKILAIPMTHKAVT